jgi:ribulose-5-phosphate 4-epimerase/fuculose-1-phosphate aldolase
MSFYNSIAYDDGFNGAAVTPAEGERLAGVIGKATVLMMMNHGPLVIGSTLGEALLRLIYLEDTCKIQLLAEAGGSELKRIAPEIVATYPDDSPMFKAYGRTFMKAIIRKLTREEPDFLS